MSRSFAKPGDSSTHGALRNASVLGPAVVANDIVSEVLEAAIRVVEKRSPQFKSMPANHDDRHFGEFWVSLASLLRSYTALHGLPSKLQPLIESDEERITVSHGKKSLILTRKREILTWVRENGSRGLLEFTAAGALHGLNGDQAMDLTAEQWAREIMQ